MANTEKGTLSFGVEHKGEIHRDFEIREQLVRDSVEAIEDKEHGARAEKSDSFFSVCVTARRLLKLGGIPKEAITPDLIMDMRQEDLNEIHAASKRLEEARRRFRGAGEDIPKDGDSPA